MDDVEIGDTVEVTYNSRRVDRDMTHVGTVTDTKVVNGTVWDIVIDDGNRAVLVCDDGDVYSESDVILGPVENIEIQ